MAELLDQWIEQARKCQYLPENDLKVMVIVMVIVLAWLLLPFGLFSDVGSWVAVLIIHRNYVR